MLGALDRLPLPLIARVQGQALGGGVGLLAVCDAAVAAEGARFGLTETRLGLIPATIAPYVLARLGPRAREVFFSSRVFGAEEARELGLVRRVLGAEALDEAVEAELAPYLAVAPGAVADAKALFHRLRGGADAAAIEATVQALADRWETEEAQAGVEAFLARRPAPWADG
jgi:methylglutaconyl-CoA hydratase